MANAPWIKPKSIAAAANPMIKFENLPANVQALILAKLALELDTQNVVSIHHLAHKTQVDIKRVWSNVCRKARQPVCTIPVEAMQKQ
jgi:hypothetical protein